MKAKQLDIKLFEEEKVLEGKDEILKSADETIYDFGDHYVGTFSLSLSSVGRHQDAPVYLQVNFAEIKEEFDKDADSYNGWISKSWIQEERVHIDVLPTTYRFERRYAFRYVKIKVLAVSENYALKIDRLSVKAVSSADRNKLSYPSFTEADQKLDQVSLRTLHNCMQEVFEDGPKRDRRLWLGDLRLEALVNYHSFRNYDLVRRCLYLFAGSTMEQGRLSSNIFLYPEVECDDQTMFDYTLFFIDVLWDYYTYTNDLETLKELEPVCMRQYELLKDCFDENDRIDLNKSGRVFIDWNFDLDKTASGQAVYIYALRDLVKIEETLGKDTAKLEEEITRKTNAALKMFDETQGLFLSGEDRQISYASQIWMILAKVTDEETGRAILKKLETADAVRLNSPYAYHHYIQALIDVGLKEEAYEKMHSYWGGMIEKGSDTFWEIYDPKDPYVSPYGGLIVHSFCHAWSCTPSYFLRKYYY